MVLGGGSIQRSIGLIYLFDFHGLQADKGSRKMCKEELVCQPDTYLEAQKSKREISMRACMAGFVSTLRWMDICLDTYGDQNH